MGATTFWMLKKEREARAKREGQAVDTERHETETEPKPEEPEEQKINSLSVYTVDDLKGMAKASNIERYYNMNKSELIVALEGLNG